MTRLVATVWVVMVAACSFDTGASPPATASDGGGTTPDGQVVVIDAGPPDAVPVECSSNEQCATPPTLCQMPGTCNMSTSTCEFPDVDCTASGDDCNVGTCELATGNCVKLPAFNGNSCGAGTVCGAYGACGEFTGVCGETGSQSRTCTDHTCSLGVCEASAPRTEAITCMRDTDGVTCGDDICDAFGPCGGFSSTCDETGTRARSCWHQVCGSGACELDPFTDVGSCSRDTDGTMCMATSCTDWSPCGGFSTTCDETGTRSRVCTSYACDTGTCTGTGATVTGTCSRDTDGTVCGTVTDRVCSGMGDCELGTCMGTCMNVDIDVTCSDGTCPD